MGLFLSLSDARPPPIWPFESLAAVACCWFRLCVVLCGRVNLPIQLGVDSLHARTHARRTIIHGHMHYRHDPRAHRRCARAHEHVNTCAARRRRRRKIPPQRSAHAMHYVSRAHVVCCVCIRLLLYICVTHTKHWIIYIHTRALFNILPQMCAHARTLNHSHL